MQFACRFGSDSIFITCDNIAVIIIHPSCGFAKGYVVLACHATKRIVFISASGSTILKDFNDIAHAVITVLNRFIEHAIRCKSHSGRKIGCMVAKLDIGNLFFGNRRIIDLNLLSDISTKCIGVGDYSFAVNSNAVKRLFGGSL